MCKTRAIIFLFNYLSTFSSFVDFLSAKEKINFECVKLSVKRVEKMLWVVKCFTALDVVEDYSLLFYSECVWRKQFEIFQLLVYWISFSITNLTIDITTNKLKKNWISFSINLPLKSILSHAPNSIPDSDHIHVKFKW